jgi:hypothetical protein
MEENRGKSLERRRSTPQADFSGETKHQLGNCSLSFPIEAQYFLSPKHAWNAIHASARTDRLYKLEVTNEWHVPTPKPQFQKWKHSTQPTDPMH